MDNWHMATIAQKGTVSRAKKRARTAASRNADLLPVIQSIRADGATSPQRIANALNALGIKPAQPQAKGEIEAGIAPKRQRSAVQVRRVLLRSNAA